MDYIWRLNFVQKNKNLGVECIKTKQVPKHNNQNDFLIFEISFSISVIAFSIFVLLYFQNINLSFSTLPLVYFCYFIFKML